jgi:hypothetical protein
MSGEQAMAVLERRDGIIPPIHQNQQPAAELLHSANAGVVVEQVAQVRAGFRREARSFAQERAASINTHATGGASMFVYEELFGTRDRLHFLLHMPALDSGIARARIDAAAPEQVDDAWNRLFVEGSVRETVLIPQFWGMYGTRIDGNLEKQSEVYRNTRPVALPTARQQVSLPDEQILHSANAGIVMHRSAQIVYDFRSEARKFGREVAESINRNLPGACSVFVYEEAFGLADRLHWLIHLEDLSTYLRLLELHVRDEEVRDIYFRDRIATEKGGGTWARMFVDGTMADVALTMLR